MNLLLAVTGSSLTEGPPGCFLRVLNSNPFVILTRDIALFTC